MKYTWKDQPEVVAKVDVAFSFNTKTHKIEIRACPEPNDPSVHNRCYYVTAGNLFGSQSIRVYGENKLFELLNVVGKKNPKLPEGAEIVG